MCSGGQYSGAFRNCTFAGCQLCIVHGAAATIRGCTFSHCNPALTACGAHTLATLSDCTFTDCPCAILATTGAAVDADDAAISRVIAGVVVDGPGSRVTLAAATMVGGSRGVCRGSCALHVQGSAAALRGCTMDGFTIAALVRESHASLEVHATNVVRCAQGVVGSGHTRTLLRQFELECETSEDSGLGIHESEAQGFKTSAKLQLERCRVDWKCIGALASALTLEAYNAVAMTLCKVSSHHLAIAAGRNSRVHMSACSLLSGEVAARASGKGCTLRAADSSVNGAKAACLAGDGAAAAFCDTALACHPESTAPDAVTVSGAGAATIRLLRCVLMHGTTGLRVEDRSSVVSVATHVAIPPNIWSRSATGYACVNSVCEVRDGIVSGWDVGALVQGTCGAGGPGAVFRELQFEGCVDAVRVESTAAARSDVEITGSVIHEGECGVVVMAENKSEVAVVLEGCSMQGNAEGVQVYGAFADVTLRRCHITGFQDGVTHRGAGVVRMHDVNVLTEASGVTVGCERITSPCWACGRDGKAAEAAAWAAAHASRGRAVAGARCVHEGGIARLTMERVRVRDIECGQGIVVAEFGHLSAADCRVEGCESGIEVAYIHEPSRFERCTVVALPGEPGTQMYQLLSPSDDSLGDGDSDSGDDSIEGVEVMEAEDAPPWEERYAARDARGIKRFVRTESGIPEYKWRAF